MSRPLHALVVGGSLAGLVAALALARHGAVQSFADSPVEGVWVA